MHRGILLIINNEIQVTLNSDGSLDLINNTNKDVSLIYLSGYSNINEIGSNRSIKILKENITYGNGEISFISQSGSSCLNLHTFKETSKDQVKGNSKGRKLTRKGK